MNTTNNSPSLLMDGYIGLYKSISGLNHKIYKWQGQIKLDKVDFWTDHYQKDDSKVLLTSLYYGDRIDSDFNLYS